MVRKGEDVSLKIEVLDHEVRILQSGKGIIESKALLHKKTNELIRIKSLPQQLGLCPTVLKS